MIQFLEEKKWVLLYQRLKTAVAEVDLIFEKEDQIVLLEVKTLNNSWRAFERIQAQQVYKLQKNLVLFSNGFKQKKFKAYVVWVSDTNKISFVELN